MILLYDTDSLIILFSFIFTARTKLILFINTIRYTMATSEGDGMDVEEKLLYAARNGDSKTVGVLLDKNHQGYIKLNINCKGNLL